MVMENATKWLLIEGILPLLGAAILYLLMGMSSYVVSSKGTFNFNWLQAFDPLGWLYGGTIIAVQAGIKAMSLPSPGMLPATCFVVSAVCLLILMAAMNERGKHHGWAPPNRLKSFSALLVIVTLYAGYQTQFIASGESQ